MTNFNVKYRMATNADVPALKELVFSVLEEYGLKPDPDDTDLDLSDIEAFYFQKGGYFEVCEVEGCVVGSWGLYPNVHDSCELRKMYLASSQRGKGLGKAMLERALNKAREMRFKRVELETASVLKEAVGLYLKHGFTPITNRHLVERCDQAFELYL
ncbi:MAG: GNAT family N-acetyltransferase [Bdellovibrionales bacterium CG10_big_fil_rev_8_21_14_0_10_45_34]|nr:MAG: GNAT family N-acetyltransferase [Bdellovibrionales bacterium CG10_big_fil_rev_8_21_14_0_10_45_34]